jgi:hypothetical protein
VHCCSQGATGNVATEDVIYLLNDLGIDCGVDLEKAADAGKFITGLCGRERGMRDGEGGHRGMENVEKKEEWRMRRRKRIGECGEGRGLENVEKKEECSLLRKRITSGELI